MYISSHLLHNSLRSLWKEGAKLQASLWVLLLAGAWRSDVDALDQGRLQSDVELLQRLQHADQGIDKCVVFDQCHILIHVCGDGAIGQQGDPVVQEVVSGREGSIPMGQRDRRQLAKAQGEPAPSPPEPSMKQEKQVSPHSPLLLP